MSDIAVTLPTADAMGFYLESGLAKIADQFGEAQRYKHPALLAAWMQGCTTIHAAASLGSELGDAIDSAQDGLGIRIGLALADLGDAIGPMGAVS